MVSPSEPQDPRRRYPRVELRKGIPVGWQGGGKFGTSRIVSVSLGGVFISTEDPPAQGSIVKLIFDVPAGEVRAGAVVRYSVPGKGMGIQFINMGPDDRGRLYLLLGKLLGPEKDKQ